MTARITVDALECSVCGERKPLTEFYDSEVCTSKRCKSCFRARIDAANKRSGRRSTSLSVPEVVWLNTLLRALPSSGLRDLARRPEYVVLARKVATMAAQNTKRKGLEG